MIMMIFVTTTDSLTDEKLYEKAYSLIPEYRKAKADKMKMRENKLQTVTAGLLLNYAVGKWSIKTGERDYKTDENLYEKVDIISVIEANNQYFDYLKLILVSHSNRFYKSRYYSIVSGK